MQSNETTQTPRDDEREALAQAIHDGPSAALELATMGIAVHDFASCAYREPYLADADAILASDVWRNRHRGPITDEMVDAAHERLAHLIAPGWDDVRAALEAAEAARANQADRGQR